MMTDETILHNGVAPLVNVALLAQMIKRLQGREHGLPGIGCCFGRAGLGKTTAAIYATNALNACHVEALPIGGVKGMLSMIVTELGLKPERTTEGLFTQAAKYLGSTQRVLIIDEADAILKDKCVEILRRLHDISQAPLIFMGEEMLPQNLQKWERVHSRVLTWVGMEEATSVDVDHLAKIYARGVTIAPQLKTALLAASRGSLRNVSTNLAHIREVASRRGVVSLGMEEWKTETFRTGEAPAPRGISGKSMRRGYAV
jgi:DNA transposition AAA+ family ATPase